MLIIYPLENYDSFVSVADATTIINSMTLNGAEWEILDEPTQESLLRIACRTIVDGIDLVTYPLPDPAPDCLAEANALMAVHDSVNNLSSGTEAAPTGSLKKQKVASIEVEYYDSGAPTSSGSVSRIPDMAKPCLESLHFSLPSTTSGLSQSTLGHS